MKLLIPTLLALSLFLISEARADNFLPTWKLLRDEEKIQFIAGYLAGWKDATVVTDTLISYARENPSRTAEGLEKVRSLYDVSDLKPAFVAKAIDEFYQLPGNHRVSLSAAISSIKRTVSKE